MTGRDGRSREEEAKREGRAQNLHRQERPTLRFSTPGVVNLIGWAQAPVGMEGHDNLVTTGIKLVGHSNVNFTSSVWTVLKQDCGYITLQILIAPLTRNTFEQPVDLKGGTVVRSAPKRT